MDVIPPLDYARLQTQGEVFVELGRTTAELAKWLTIVEDGLGAMLDFGRPSGFEEEEQEDQGGSERRVFV